MMTMKKETADILLAIRSHIRILEDKYDYMSVKEFVKKSESEQGYIKGWTEACQAILLGIPVPGCIEKDNSEQSKISVF